MNIINESKLSIFLGLLTITACGSKVNNHDRRSFKTIESEVDQDSELKRRSDPFHLNYNGNEEEEDIFWGDMQLTKEQQSELQSNRLNLTNGASFSVNLFPKGIVPYKYDGSISNLKKRQIENIINIMNNNGTGIIYRTAKRSDKAHIVFYDNYSPSTNSGSCTSYVGADLKGHDIPENTWGPPTKVNLGCWIAKENQDAPKRVIMHEIMHAMGFNHEHIREDRGNYIIVQGQNSSRPYSFDTTIKTTRQVLGVPYDINSAMHDESCLYTEHPECWKARENNLSWEQKRRILENHGVIIKRTGYPYIHPATTMSDLDLLAVKLLYKDEIAKRQECFHSNVGDYRDIFMKVQGNVPYVTHVNQYDVSKVTRREEWTIEQGDKEYNLFEGKIKIKVSGDTKDQAHITKVCIK